MVGARAADVLAAKAPGAPVTVVEADAMALDWAALLGAGPDWALVANLPYNVATPLVADLLDGVPAVQRMLVMVQREVGQRLVAAPGDPAYGAVSVKVAYWAEAALVGAVPSSVFVPQPRVGSVLVSLKRRRQPLAGTALVPCCGAVPGGKGRLRPATEDVEKGARRPERERTGF